MSNFYCIWVKTGFENKFVERLQVLFDSVPDEQNGKLHCIGKQIRLRNGKEFIDPLLPGYVFWETDNISRIQDIKDEEGFIDFLPNDNGIKPLSAKDTELVTSFLKYGSVIPVVKVQFDVNDRIVIVDGLFKASTQEKQDKDNKDIKTNILLDICCPGRFNLSR